MLRMLLCRSGIGGVSGVHAACRTFTTVLWLCRRSQASLKGGLRRQMLLGRAQSRAEAPVYCRTSGMSWTPWMICTITPLGVRSKRVLLATTASSWWAFPHPLRSVLLTVLLLKRRTKVHTSCKLTHTPLHTSTTDIQGEISCVCRSHR